MPTTDPAVFASDRRRGPPTLQSGRPPQGRVGPTFEAGRSFEEGVAVGGGATDHDRRVRESIDELDLTRLSAAIAGEALRRGVSFGSANGERAFRIDPIPRVIDASE